MASFSEVRSTVYDWVFAALSIPVIWADSNVKRTELTLPFVSLRLAGISKTGVDYRGRPNGSGEATVVGNRESTLDIQCVGAEDGSHPSDLLNQLLDSVNFESNRSILRNGGVVVFTEGPVRDISVVLDGVNEPRALATFQVRWASTVVDSGAGVIERVDIEATMDERLIDISVNSNP